jgi:AraC-like DNA-binding protein
MAVVLGAHLLALLEQAPHMSVEEAASIASASLALVASCLAGFADGRASVPQAEVKAPLLLARRFIDEHLASPDLGLAMLAQGLGMSRSTLFRLFEPFGGVARYILHRRMTRAFHQVVSNRYDARRIGEIAHSVGIANEASFSRAFRRTFGVSPREARLMARPPAIAPADMPVFHSWLQDLMPEA